jgi:hypothetical protein
MIGKHSIAGVVVTILGVLVAITPRYIFPVCEYFGVRMQEMNGTSEPMGCYYTARASLILGLVIVVVGIALFLATQPQTRSLLAMVLAGASVLVILTPTVFFPICHNPDMHCNKGSKPMLIVLGIASLITAAWLVASAASAKKSKSQISQSSASAG